MMIGCAFVLLSVLADPPAPAPASQPETAPVAQPQDAPDRALLEFLGEFPDDEDLEASAQTPIAEPEHD